MTAGAAMTHDLKLRNIKVSISKSNFHFPTKFGDLQCNGFPVIEAVNENLDDVVNQESG